jgi:hypothetical protein
LDYLFQASLTLPSLNRFLASLSCLATWIIREMTFILKLYGKPTLFRFLGDNPEK